MKDDQTGDVNLRALRSHLAATLNALDRLIGSDVIPRCSGNTQVYPLIVAGLCEAITRHAIDRYRERTSTTRGELSTINKIRDRLANSDEWELKEEFRLMELLSHDTPARYFKHGEMFFVVVNKLVVTAHSGTADRWQQKRKPVCA